MRSIAQAAERPAESSLAEAAQTSAQPLLASAITLYRLPQVLARIPVSKSSWFAGIQAGLYPRGYHLGPRTTVWRSDDIDRVIERMCAQSSRASVLQH